MKYCKDCKHYFIGSRSGYSFCNRKNVIDKGTVNDFSNLCAIERGYGWLLTRLENLCGREGRFYEPKETTLETPDVTTPSERTKP